MGFGAEEYPTQASITKIKEPSMLAIKAISTGENLERLWVYRNTPKWQNLCFRGCKHIQRAQKTDSTLIW